MEVLMEVLKEFFKNRNIPVIVLANVASELVAAYVMIKQPSWLAEVFGGQTTEFVQFPVSIYPLYSTTILVLYALLCLRYVAARIKNSG